MKLLLAHAPDQVAIGQALHAFAELGDRSGLRLGEGFCFLGVPLSFDLGGGPLGLLLGAPALAVGQIVAETIERARDRADLIAAIHARHSVVIASGAELIDRACQTGQRGLHEGCAGQEQGRQNRKGDQHAAGE